MGGKDGPVIILKMTVFIEPNFLLSVIKMLIERN